MDCLIKWSGSKRHQAKEIIDLFPYQIQTYYEPFCGGCSVAFRLMENNHKINKYILSDVNNSLTDFYKKLQNNISEICFYYENFHNKLREKGQEFYYNIREKYNNEKNGLDLFCLTRTCFNGLIRYNKDGNFNVSFYHNRFGINPMEMKQILLFYYDLINKHDVSFVCQRYTEYNPKIEDFIYLDPPYFNCKAMYYGNIDFENFLRYLSVIQCKWAVSLGTKTKLPLEGIRKVEMSTS